jgi:hypothetical protein
LFAPTPTSVVRRTRARDTRPPRVASETNVVVVDMLPSWLVGGSDSEYTSSEDEEDHHHHHGNHDDDALSPRSRGKLRAIGSTVKHEAQNRLSQLARSKKTSEGLDTAVDAIDRFMTDPSKSRERVEGLKQKSKEIWTNAMVGDHEKIEKTKRGTVKALEITEKLAKNADPDGEVAETFADAARRMKDIVETGKNRDEVLEMSKALGKDLWGKLSTKAGQNDHFSGMRGTVERIVDRVKGLMKKLQDEKLKRDEEEAISAVLNAGDTSSDAIDTRLKTLAEESKDVWSDLRADEQLKALLKDEIVPGFERLIRGAVQVSCELMSKLELPRVDGVYDSPIGSVCYHVDNVRFTEFNISKDSLRVVNHMDEDDEGAGLSTTVEVRDINTVMQDVEFAYCEFPRNWGVVDGEGLCTVTVDGASVGITYEIIINTAQLLKLVNQGVELAKDDSKIAEMRGKIEEKIKARKEAKAREAEAKKNGEATSPKPVVAPVATKAPESTAESEEFNSPTSEADALGAALDRAFGGGMFSDAPETVESPPLSPTSPTFHDATDDAKVLDIKEKLTRNRRVVSEILGEGFLGEEPVLELRVHTTHISVGELDVQISGTSAAWLYNMIALVLTQQLRGTIEEKINNITVKQLARISGAVAAYSAGLIDLSIYQEDEEDDFDVGSMLSGVTGSLRVDAGKWGEDWICSHCPGEAPEHVQARRKFGSRSQSKASFDDLGEIIPEDDDGQAPARHTDEGIDWHDVASPM